MDNMAIEMNWHAAKLILTHNLKPRPQVLNWKDVDSDELDVLVYKCLWEYTECQQ
jgi:hypothetical protein